MHTTQFAVYNDYGAEFCDCLHDTNAQRSDLVILQCVKLL